MIVTLADAHPRRFARLAAALVLGFVFFLAHTLHAQSSVIAVDLYNKKIHIASNANVKRAVGGLTMITTALVALDWQNVTKVSLNTLATVSPMDMQIAGANPLSLEAGDQLTLRDLIYASMMSSDNLAATTLADFVGQDILSRRGKHADPIAEFVGEMNKLAQREGASKTHFTNPHGLENSRTVPYSTAADIAKITLYALSRAPLKYYTSQKKRDITVIRGGKPTTVPLENTNLLLGQDSIDGVKTGNTAQSGGCVAISAEKPGTVLPDPSTGKHILFRHRMVVVVLGSQDPFAEASSALKQAWEMYEQWEAAGRQIKDPKELITNFN